MRSVFSKSPSPCQIICGLRPVTSSIAWATSTSRLEPGKTRTEAFMLVPHHLAGPRASRPAHDHDAGLEARAPARGSPASSAHQLDRVVLDHRVGQKLAAHLVEPRLGLGLVGLGELELDEL